MLKVFLRSDVQSYSLRETYLAYAHNVKLGHHGQLYLTGNAFNVEFSITGVIIENLWDEDVDAIHLDLDDFISNLRSWHLGT